MDPDEGVRDVGGINNGEGTLADGEGRKSGEVAGVDEGGIDTGRGAATDEDEDESRGATTDEDEDEGTGTGTGTEEGGGGGGEVGLETHTCGWSLPNSKGKALPSVARGGSSRTVPSTLSKRIGNWPSH